MATEPDDDDKKRQQAQNNQGFSQANAQNAANQGFSNANTQRAQGQGFSDAQQSYPFQRTFQPPAGGATPGQQTPMPWSGMNQAYGGTGGATPWAQNMAGFNNAYAQNQANQGAQAGFGQALGGAPNWAALAQRFGGGQQLGNASPAFQRPQFGGWGGQGMAGGQQNPWLQQLMQGAAQRIAAARAAGGAPQQGLPQQQGFAMPQWGGGMPQWGGRQY